ncbi:MAG: hypothetical protein JWN04_6668 [Myxococcaceae bacterium]|nr:hypothetical protein [Myxococcaceae bacterium]
MQYDVRRSNPSKTAKTDPEAPSHGPLLRERLIDVIRRDRAIAAIADAQRETQREPETAVLADFRPSTLPPDAGLDPEAKSGTHVRLPGYARVELDDDDVEELEPTQEHWAPKRVIAEADQQRRASPLLSMFADWIEEEIIEIDASSDMPIVFLPEPPPLPHAARPAPQPLQLEAHAVAAAAPVARSEPEPPPQGLALILEADAEAEAELSKQEPIRTRTMARLLASHGYTVRALSIYDYLIARDPSDVSLRVEAASLRAAKK